MAAQLSKDFRRCRLDVTIKKVEGAVRVRRVRKQRRQRHHELRWQPLFKTRQITFRLALVLERDLGKLSSHGQDYTSDVIGRQFANVCASEYNIVTRASSTRNAPGRGDIPKSNFDA